MNEFELFHKDGRPTGVWCCGKCRLVKHTEAEAAKCCGPTLCQQCGQEAEQYYTLCPACIRQKNEAKEQARFEAAEKIPAAEWTGWVYCDGCGYNEGYFPSGGAFLDWLDDWYDEHDEGETRPMADYLWACRSQQVVNADVSDLTERMEAWEDWDPDTLDGLPEIKAALEAFNAVNAGVLSYTPDYTKVIVLEAREPAAGTAALPAQPGTGSRAERDSQPQAAQRVERGDSNPEPETSRP